MLNGILFVLGDKGDIGPPGKQTQELTMGSRLLHLLLTLDSLEFIRRERV